MSAISLWQPWASFIAIGVKPYETRHWAAPRHLWGQRIAIHAAKHPVTKDDREWWQRVAGDMPLPLGGYVCTAILGRPVPTDAVEEDDYGNYGSGRWAWPLTDIEIIDPFIPAKGMQGFWRWEGHNVSKSS